MLAGNPSLATTLHAHQPGSCTSQAVANKAEVTEECSFLLFCALWSLRLNQNQNTTRAANAVTWPMPLGRRSEGSHMGPTQEMILCSLNAHLEVALALRLNGPSTLAQMICG